jgi:HlyD family secretion protein
VDPVRIFVDVPEADAASVNDGDAARVRVQVLGDRQIRGKVTRNAWALNARTRTLRAEIDLPNADGTLRPGMYAHAAITVERANAWTLPVSAVATQGDQAYCYRVEDGKAVRTPVKVGIRDKDVVEVLKKQTKADGPGDDAWEDLTGDEQIVQGGLGALADGQAVTVGQAIR